MGGILETELNLDSTSQGHLSDLSELKNTEDEDSLHIVKSIHLFDDQFVIKEKTVESDDLYRENPTDKLAGVYLQGIQYYDLKNIRFINHSGVANLIDLLKSLLKEGVEVQFVNVNKNIKHKIKSMGLDHILNCR